MDVCTSWPLLDEILRSFRARVGADFAGYRNHTYRVLNFCRAFGGPADDVPETLVVAAGFHDIGIWTDRTFDYLEPSAGQAQQYLCAHGFDDRVDEVQSVIRTHHAIRRCRGAHAAHAEVFRRADLVDVSLGLIRFGAPGDFVAEVRRAFPDAGFHRRLVQLTARQFLRTPLTPLPMVRW